jgi:two-component system sensor kinase FixL
MRRYLETGEARVIGIGRKVEARHSSGRVFPIGLSIGEVVKSGERHFVGMIRDLSEERAAELRNRSLEARLAHVGRFNLMGEMAAGIAHEVNQPLTAIATYAQTAKRMLRRNPVPVGELSDICDKIDSQAHRASHVIQNIRKFIRQQDVGSEILDVNRVIADVWDLVEADTRAAGVTATARYGKNLPAIRADALQLQQVVLNLTRNSVDAMSTGHSGGAVAVETALTPDGRVRISVSDNGPGVSRTLGNNIFHPFVTTKPEGLGVGLAMSRSIVHSYGGELGFSENPEGGAVFTIHLKAESGAAEHE